MLIYKGFSNKFKEGTLGKFTQVSKVASKIEKGFRLMGLTMGEFSLVDLIHGILQVVGKSEVHCVTWSAGIKDANNVAWMVNSNLIDSFTLITDHSYVTRQSKYACTLEEIFGKENIRTGEVHAKFTLIKNADWNICIRTSMNLNANKTCESFEIDDSKEVYDFYKSYIDTHFEHQAEGFLPSSATVNKTMGLFFGETVQQSSNNSKHWSDL